MASDDNITAWIDGVREGDSQAVHQLWTEYFDRLTKVARKQLDGSRRTAVDEEDVALSAFKSFCLAARDGRLRKMVDRESLWPLLVSITANKSVDAMRRENRKKRGGTGKAMTDTDDAELGRRIDGSFTANDFLCKSPSPEFAVQLSEQFQFLLQQLDETGDPQIRQVALLKFEGASSTEIAAELKCARRTVERKLKIVRRLILEQFQELADE